MKTLLKIIVILTVAVTVAGLLYGAVTLTSSNTNGSSSMSERFENRGNQFQDRDGGGGFSFPADSIKNLLIIAAISAVYVNGVKLLSSKRAQGLPTI